MIQSSPNEPAKVLDLARLAQSFEEIAVDVIQGETTEFLTRWYRASNGEADLSVWWDAEKRVVKQQLCFYGQVVEWNPIHGARTGLVIEHEAVGENELPNANDFTSETIQFDLKASRSAIDQAQILLSAMTALKLQERDLLVFNFRESPRLHKNARERAIRAWAPQSEELLKGSSRPGFWKNLSSWLFGR